MKTLNHLPLSKKLYKLNTNYSIYIYKPFNKKIINLINNVSNIKIKNIKNKSTTKANYF